MKTQESASRFVSPWRSPPVQALAQFPSPCVLPHRRATRLRWRPAFGQTRSRTPRNAI